MTRKDKIIIAVIVIGIYCLVAWVGGPKEIDNTYPTNVNFNDTVTKAESDSINKILDSIR